MRHTIIDRDGSALSGDMRRELAVKAATLLRNSGTDCRVTGVPNSDLETTQVFRLDELEKLRKRCR